MTGIYLFCVAVVAIWAGTVLGGVGDYITSTYWTKTKSSPPINLFEQAYGLFFMFVILPLEIIFQEFLDLFRKEPPRLWKPGVYSGPVVLGPEDYRCDKWGHSGNYSDENGSIWCPNPNCPKIIFDEDPQIISSHIIEIGDIQIVLKAFTIPTKGVM